MKDGRLGNTNLIVNEMFVILTFLEWNFRIEAFSYYGTNFLCRSSFELEKVYLNWKMKSPSQMESRS